MEYRINRRRPFQVDQMAWVAETLPAGPAKGWEELDRLFLRLLQEKE